MDPSFVERNVTHASTAYRHVDVPTVRFEDVLAEVGIPRYLKVDIEGFDMLCVRALRAFEDRPDFVSIESAVTSNQAPFHKVFDELAELWSLGYRRFSYVNQQHHPRHRPPNPPREGQYADIPLTEQHSGFFGEEMPGRWSGIESTLARAQVLRTRHNLTGFGGAWSDRRGLAYRALRKLAGRSGWYDLHARL